MSTQMLLLLSSDQMAILVLCSIPIVTGVVVSALHNYFTGASKAVKHVSR